MIWTPHRAIRVDPNSTRSFGHTIPMCETCGGNHCWWCGLPMQQAGCTAWSCGWPLKPVHVRLRWARMALVMGMDAIGILIWGPGWDKRP